MFKISIREEVINLRRIGVTLFLNGVNIFTGCRVLNRHTVLRASGINVVNELIDILEPDIAINVMEIFT